MTRKETRVKATHRVLIGMHLPHPKQPGTEVRLEPGTELPAGLLTTAEIEQLMAQEPPALAELS